VTVAELLEAPCTTMGDLREHIDGLSPASRVAECLALTAAQQKRLWAMASAEPAMTGVLLPPGSPSAVFAGRNSLRLFTRFEKRFAGSGRATVGHNNHSLSWLIGPGYFMVKAGDGRGLLFDYEQVPAQSPPGWPAVARNSGTFARPVYGGLVDRVEWVSADVLVGSAYRSDEPLASYFVLARVLA